MQTIEAAAQRMRQVRDADATPPPPPAYSPKLRPAPAALDIKTRVLGELVAEAPAAASPPVVALPTVRGTSWRWMAAALGVGMALGGLIQWLWLESKTPAEPLAVAPRLGAPAAPARASEPVATHAGARAVETTLPIKPATPTGPVASAAAVAAPAAPAATASPQPADASSDVRERVTHWVAAWSARDIDRYLAFYAKDFAPGGGLTRAAWEAQRRARLSGATSIQVAVRDVRIEPDGADRATVRFTQDYTSGSYREIGTRKRLVMRRDDGRWRIVSEGTDA